MRPDHPERGVTLIELVLSIVIVGIIVAAVAFFLTPLQQGADLAARAELTDIADNALQRIGRDVKLALPNSVRRATNGGVEYVEFLSLREAGRYRGDLGSVAGGTPCEANDPSLSVADNDQLSFDIASGDQCFKTIGLLASPGSVTTSDYLVLNNFGEGFAGQNAYEAGAANRAQIDAAIGIEAGRNRVHFAQTPFSRALHDSPAKRFFIISGPVTYACDPVGGTVRRHWDYGTAPFPTRPLAAQPTTPAALSSGGSALIAEYVTACSFSYASVGPQLGLLTMQITLRRQLFGGNAETVSLYHAVHVNNAP